MDDGVTTGYESRELFENNPIEVGPTSDR